MVLSKTAKLVLFHCTYCVEPTRPFTSGGLLEGENPARPTPTPSKLRPVGLGAEATVSAVVCCGPRGPPLCVGGLGGIGSR